MDFGPIGPLLVTVFVAIPIFVFSLFFYTRSKYKKSPEKYKISYYLVASAAGLLLLIALVKWQVVLGVYRILLNSYF